MSMNNGYVLKIIQWLGPMVIAIFAAWGASQFSSGATQTRITNLENQAKDFIPREEVRVFMDNTTQNLNNISADIRELRNQENSRDRIRR